MVLDIAKYGVEEDGVVFNLVTPPTYGTLALDLLTSRTDHSFTLQDINRDKVILLYILFPSSKEERTGRRGKKEKEKKRKEKTLLLLLPPPHYPPLGICSSLCSDNNHEFGEAKEVKDVGKVMLSPGSSYGQSL